MKEKKFDSVLEKNCAVRRYTEITLTLQKSRIPQVQGIKAAAVVVYRKALITQEMRYHRLS